jgi:hypothetical protein
VGRVWPRHRQRGRPLNSVVRHMSFCPNCGSTVQTSAKSCESCSAIFGPNSSWAPREQPPPRPLTGWQVLGKVLLWICYPLVALAVLATCSVTQHFAEGQIIMVGATLLFGPFIIVGHLLLHWPRRSA